MTLDSFFFSNFYAQALNSMVDFASNRIVFGVAERQANPEIIAKLIPAYLSSQVSGTDAPQEDGSGSSGGVGDRRSSLLESTVTASATTMRETATVPTPQISEVPLSASEENAATRSRHSSGRRSPETQQQS